MSEKMVRVAGLGWTYGYGTPTKYYGPSSGPIDIPEGLAVSLGLQAVAEGEPASAGTPERRSVKDTLEAIDRGELTAQEALDRERAGAEPRSTLVAELEKRAGPA